MLSAEENRRGVNTETLRKKYAVEWSFIAVFAGKRSDGGNRVGLHLCVQSIKKYRQGGFPFGVACLQDGPAGFFLRSVKDALWHEEAGLEERH